MVELTPTEDEWIKEMLIEEYGDEWEDVWYSGPENGRYGDWLVMLLKAAKEHGGGYKAYARQEIELAVE